LEKIKVLIADDQEIIRKSLAIVLNMSGDIEVAGTAENGAAAVEMTGRLAPDVVLMDVQMPVMNGVDATKAIKKANPDVLVIMLTTFQEAEVVTGALNAGAEGYLLKAIDPEDLADAIRLVHRGETMITREVAKTLFARATTGSAFRKENEYGLSEREAQVLQCIAQGLSNRDIADKLYLSLGTVKNYISSIYSKLNVHNRTTAMKKAAEEGLL
jgi:DNA-binding NarL/FixJ family response regulator